LLEYEDIKFQNASKEDLKLSDEEKSKKQEKKLRETFKPLTKWWRKLLGDDGNVEAVRVSNRLSTTPCVIVTSKCDARTWIRTKEEHQVLDTKY
jgi:heat shock protein beta